MNTTRTRKKYGSLSLRTKALFSTWSSYPMTRGILLRQRLNLTKHGLWNIRQSDKSLSAKARVSTSSSHRARIKLLSIRYISSNNEKEEADLCKREVERLDGKIERRQAHEDMIARQAQMGGTSVSEAKEGPGRGGVRRVEGRGGGGRRHAARSHGKGRGPSRCRPGRDWWVVIGGS